MALSRLWLVARLCSWLCCLPILVRTRSLPVLLERLVPVRKRPRSCDLGLDETVQLVTRICRVRIFEMPIFPKPCLRRALALSYVLSGDGHPVEIHFGVRRSGSDLHGHSWVTIEGESLGERNPAELFRTTYSFNFARGRSGLQFGEPLTT